MKTDDWIKIISLVSSIIALLNTYSKIGENNQLSENYFEKVLNIYIKEYSRNRALNPIKFIKRRFNRGDYFIPSYIFYLLEKEDQEKLHKVLIIDYREKFPSKKNKIAKGISNIDIFISGVMAFIYYFIMAICVVSVIVTLICLIGNLILSKSMDIEYVKIFEIAVLTIIIGVIIIWQFIVLVIDSDDYSMKIRHIEKKINKKVNKFRDDEENYFL